MPNISYLVSSLSKSSTRGFRYPARSICSAILNWTGLIPFSLVFSGSNLISRASTFGRKLRVLMHWPIPTSQLGSWHLNCYTCREKKFSKLFSVDMESESLRPILCNGFSYGWLFSQCWPTFNPATNCLAISVGYGKALPSSCCQPSTSSVLLWLSSSSESFFSDDDAFSSSSSSEAADPDSSESSLSDFDLASRSHSCFAYFVLVFLILPPPS